MGTSLYLSRQPCLGDVLVALNRRTGDTEGLTVLFNGKSP